MNEASPIFIVGTERSGSNLLRLILNAHSNIVVPHPPHLMNYFGHLDYGDLRQGQRQSELLTDMLTLIQTHIFPWDDVRLEQDLILQMVQRDTHFGLVASIYEQVRQQSGKDRWGCKSTFMIHYLDEVLAVYPEARFILLVRDPRDVSASAKRSVFSPCHPFLSAKLWNEQQQIGLRAMARYPDHVHRLRYEDVLEDPEHSLKVLCSFLGEDFENGMLEFAQTSEAKKSAALSESWAKTATSIQRDNTRKYKKNLSDQEVEHVEYWCFETMQRFGYLPEASAQPQAPSRLQRYRIQVQEKILRLRVEKNSLQQDANHWTRWRRDATASYFSLRHRRFNG